MSETEKKLKEELREIFDNQDVDIPYDVDYWDPPGEEKIFRWRVTFFGPEGTPYVGGYFVA